MRRNRTGRALVLAVVVVAMGGASRAEAICDAELALADLDPLHGAAAIDLCDTSSGGSPGVVSATYGTADLATPLDQLPSGAVGVGLLASFGPNVLPQRGERMLALSSGTARSPSDPGYSDPAGFNKGYVSGWPAGLPYEMPACPGVVASDPHDSIALRLVLKAPSDARSFSFQFKFHTFDYPDFTCSAFNDWFFATLDPVPASGPNLAFDAEGNPVTVNSPALLQVCASESLPTGDYPCAYGTAELAGTGFDAHAATPWLTTQAPVAPDSTITLTFGILDAGDGVLDSTVLIDDFRWSTRAIEGPVTTVPEAERGASALAALAALGLGRRASSRRRSSRGPSRARMPSRL